MTPNRHRRFVFSFKPTLCTRCHTIPCVYTATLPSHTGIVADNVNLARTYAGTHDPPYLSLFLSLPRSRISVSRMCVFGSADRDGWVRPSFGQDVVLRLPRDLQREIDALWEAIAAQPMHWQWRPRFATVPPLSLLFFSEFRLSAGS